MINKEVAKKMLAFSINDLNKKKGELYISDIEADVINNACLAYLMNNKKGIETNIHSLSRTFTSAAADLFPGQYGTEEISAALIQIPQNVAWNGMWNFLKGYFREKHGNNIDEMI